MTERTVSEGRRIVFAKRIAVLTAGLAVALGASVAPAVAGTPMFHNQAPAGSPMFYNIDRNGSMFHNGEITYGSPMFYNRAATGGAMFYNQAPAVFRAASWTLLSSARWDADVLGCRTGDNYIYGRVLQSAGTYQVKVRAEWLSGSSSRDNRTFTSPRVVKSGTWLYFTLYGDQGGAKYPAGGCKVTQVAVLR